MGIQEINSNQATQTTPLKTNNPDAGFIGSMKELLASNAIQSFLLLFLVTATVTGMLAAAAQPTIPGMLCTSLTGSLATKLFIYQLTSSAIGQLALGILGVGTLAKGAQMFLNNTQELANNYPTTSTEANPTSQQIFEEVEKINSQTKNKQTDQLIQEFTKQNETQIPQAKHQQSSKLVEEFTEQNETQMPQANQQQTDQLVQEFTKQNKTQMPQANQQQPSNLVKEFTKQSLPISNAKDWVNTFTSHIPQTSGQLVQEYVNHTPVSTDWTKEFVQQGTKLPIGKIITSIAGGLMVGGIAYATYQSLTTPSTEEQEVYFDPSMMI